MTVSVIHTGIFGKKGREGMRDSEKVMGSMSKIVCLGVVAGSLRCVTGGIKWETPEVVDIGALDL